MSTKQLQQIAKDKGIFTGRKYSGVYYYGYSDGSKIHEFEFHGAWQQFSKFIAEMVAPQPGSKMAQA